jgi:hypothetical protein
MPDVTNAMNPVEWAQFGVVSLMCGVFVWDLIIKRREESKAEKKAKLLMALTVSTLQKMLITVDMAHLRHDLPADHQVVEYLAIRKAYESILESINEQQKALDQYIRGGN